MRHSPWIALALGCLLITGCTWNRHAQQRETAPTIPTAPSPASNPAVLPPATTQQPATAPEAVVVPDARESARQPPLSEPARPAEPVVAPRAMPSKPPAAIPAAPKVAAPKPPPVIATVPPPAPKAVPRTAAPPVAQQPAPAPLDFKLLGTRLRETRAIGVLTKLSLKNQVDDLLAAFRAYHKGQGKATLVELRRSYDMLLLKVLSLLQDSDPALARDIVQSRAAIWGILADPRKFTESNLMAGATP
jgi:hypothetical protein